MGRNFAKVCSICGKVETTHWKYHWNTKHATSKIKELEVGLGPLSPLEGWWDLLPENLKEKYAAVNPYRN